MQMKDRSGIRFHHLSIPSEKKRAGEIYIASQKRGYVPGTNNAYGVQWERFDADSPFPEVIRQRPHVAFEVDDMDRYLEGEELLVAPYAEAPGVTSAFISVLGLPVKLLLIDRAASGAEAINPVENGGKPLRYHHTGVPGTDTWDGEVKVPHLKLAYLPGKLNTYGVEWLRFEEGNENPDVIKFLPHIAFEVDDIDKALVGEKVLYHSGREYPEIIVAMIEVDGISIEFLQIDRSVVGDKYDG